MGDSRGKKSHLTRVAMRGKWPAADARCAHPSCCDFCRGTLATVAAPHPTRQDAITGCPDAGKSVVENCFAVRAEDGAL
jgi:hypothetical protein